MRTGINHSSRSREEKIASKLGTTRAGVIALMRYKAGKGVGGMVAVGLKARGLIDDSGLTETGRTLIQHARRMGFAVALGVLSLAGAGEARAVTESDTDRDTLQEACLLAYTDGSYMQARCLRSVERQFGAVAVIDPVPPEESCKAIYPDDVARFGQCVFELYRELSRATAADHGHEH